MGSRVLPDWTELTPECLLDIFSRLSIGQLWNGPMLVCKTWTKLCHDPSLNITLDLEAEFLSSEDSNHWWSPEFEEKVDSTIRSVVDRSKGGLKEIRVRHCTDQSLSYVAERYLRFCLPRSAEIDCIRLIKSWFVGVLILKYLGLHIAPRLLLSLWGR